ncbi:hypothetical protein PHMEG_00029577 [Phytophthora megakarya]|uniref:Reverse transcriptase n=1 Tax=Phytophthora megakarya TaxID=4795 RepID=A0A225V387_9STRA|nr:hypothetical protein PHMEG_00029577 [Phytophthora megakarya]
MEFEAPLESVVERSEYKTPQVEDDVDPIQCRKVKTSQDQGVPDCLPSDSSPSEIQPLDLTSVTGEESDL